MPETVQKSKRKSRSTRGADHPARLILAPASANDIVSLLRAWRLWLLAGLIGAVLGVAAYVLVPPPYRARATVNVDFHLEQAWPQNTDREQFYYLERETRKLVEIAMSDSVLEVVARAQPAFTVRQLRDGVLQLSQPGSGGWHFFAHHAQPDTSASLAATWAAAFADEVKGQVAATTPGALERYITVDVVRADHIEPERSQPQGWYILAGAGLALSAAALFFLFFRVD